MVVEFVYTGIVVTQLPDLPALRARCLRLAPLAPRWTDLFRLPLALGHAYPSLRGFRVPHAASLAPAGGIPAFALDSAREGALPPQ